LKRARLFASAFLFVIVSASALSHADTAPTSEPQDHLRVFLLTFGPGSDPWEKFGHNAIEISDTDTGESVAYNWGVFDFGEGWSGFCAFAWHFIQGRLLYSMRSEPTADMLDEYLQNDRSILLQELNLTPEQKQELLARLTANDTEANRYYLYDYFQKNCATMARDAIDQTVGGRVRAALEQIPTSATFRWHDRRTTAQTLWLYFFLDFALGHPIDQPLSAWQECFLPGQLADHLLSVRVPDAQGKLLPLVRSSRLLNVGSFPERRSPPAEFIYGFWAAGLSLGAVMAVLGTFGRHHRIARWAFNLFAAIWSLLAGALGALLTFSLFTNHAAAKWNENWFHCNPLSLLMIVLIPAAWRWPSAARAVTFTVLGLSVFGLLAKITPWFYQSNWPTIALALPIHAGIGWGIARLTDQRAKSVGPITPPANAQPI
jgi:hypothetical protein